jgi:hypothetical protein
MKYKPFPPDEVISAQHSFISKTKLTKHEFIEHVVNQVKPLLTRDTKTVKLLHFLLIQSIKNHITYGDDLIMARDASYFLKMDISLLSAKRMIHFLNELNLLFKKRLPYQKKAQYYVDIMPFCKEIYKKNKAERAAQEKLEKELRLQQKLTQAKIPSAHGILGT